MLQKYILLGNSSLSALQLVAGCGEEEMLFVGSPLISTPLMIVVTMMAVSMVAKCAVLGSPKLQYVVNQVSSHIMPSLIRRAHTLGRR